MIGAPVEGLNVGTEVEGTAIGDIVRGAPEVGLIDGTEVEGAPMGATVGTMEGLEVATEGEI